MTFNIQPLVWAFQLPSKAYTMQIKSYFYQIISRYHKEPFDIKRPEI